MKEPIVSVVMSVFNGDSLLRDTLDSILAQEGIEFELVVVDDGSTDKTAAILEEAARNDQRVRVLRQQNQGLTRALIAGCRAARGVVIARHDCGDRSSSLRLKRQFELISSAGDIVLVSCKTLYVGPEREPLYTLTADGEAVRQSLLHDGAGSIQGLSHHGSAMFRRNAYLDAGEYRSEFRFAQDIDLWIRLAKLGRVQFVSEVLYEARFAPDGISGVSRRSQIALMRIAVALRDAAPDEAPALLESASAVGKIRRPNYKARANGLYFLANALRKSGHRNWRKYAWNAVRLYPLHVRAWVRLLTNR